jgi:rubrerythrin
MRPNWKSKARRIQDAKRRLNEVRVWTLTCRSCGHEGDVTMPLSRLREAKLVCRECGEPIARRVTGLKPHQLPIRVRAARLRRLRPRDLAESTVHSDPN